MISRISVFFVLLWVCFPLTTSAQQSRTDSLRQELSLEKDDSRRGEILNALAHSYDRVDQDSVNFFGQELIKLAEETDYKRGFLDGYGWMASSFFYRREYDSSAHYLQLSYQLAIQLGDTIEASRLLGNIGSIHAYLGNHEEALTSFFARLEILKDYPNEYVGLGKLYNNIGTVYHRLENYDLAREYYQRALSFKLKAGNKQDILAAYMNLSSVYTRLEMADSALYFGFKSIVMAKELDDSVVQSDVWMNMATTYTSLKQYDSVELYLQRSLAIAKKIGHKETEGKNYTNLGDFNYRHGDYAKALDYHQKALDIFSVLGFKEEIKQSHYAIAKNLRSLARFEEAYEHLYQYTELKDSLFTEEQAKIITETQTKYETEQKEQQLIVKNAQLAAQSAEFSRQQIVRNVALGSAAVSILLVALFYRNYRIKGRANKEIAVKNEQLSRSLAERETLLKEIHHRVKNNLQIITSLLYLQSDKSENTDVKKLLEEGQGRVRSMALIHQKLYENDDLKYIPFDEYLKELISEIQLSFGDKGKSVRLEIDAQGIFFDVDEAVPLGLIINELTTNAFKYAFSEKLGGLFKVSIRYDQKVYYMKVSDDGIGIPVERLNETASKSLGLKLTRMLSEQLEGEYSFRNDHGTTFELKFAI